MSTKLKDVFWPELADLSPRDRVDLPASQQSDIDRIQDTDWSVHSEEVLGEARRITSAEEERGKTAESKASNLLLLAVAFIPLLIYFKIGADVSMTFLGALELIFLIVSVAYFGKSVSWAFQVVRVRNYYSVYPSDLVRMYDENPQSLPENLVAELLCAVRRNQEVVNEKVSALKMAHEFLLRTVFALLTLFVFRNIILWF